MAAASNNPNPIETWQALVGRLLDPAFLSAVAELLWPIAAIVIAVLFRRDISLLLSRIKRAKGFGGEVDFAVDDLRAEVEKAVEHPKKIEPKTVRAVSTRDSRASLPEPLDQEEEPTWRPSLFGETSLLSSPLNWEAVDRLKKLAKEVPLEAVVLVGAQLESSIKELLAAKGVSTKSTPGNRLGALVVKAYELSPAVESAIEKFLALRNGIVHSDDRPPPSTFSEVAELGLSLVELVERVQRDTLYVERAPLPVYRDENCTDRIVEFMGIVLIYPAVPGATGHITIRLTPAPADFRANEKVSHEWEKGPSMECWFRDDRNGLARKMPNTSDLFVGKPYRHLIG